VKPPGATHNCPRYPIRRILDFSGRQRSFVEQHLRYVASETMHVIVRLRKVRPREFARNDQGKDLGVDRWEKRLDRIPGDRAPSAVASRPAPPLFRGAIFAGAVALSWQGQEFVSTKAGC
jgi:hypothetical protein